MRTIKGNIITPSDIFYGEISFTKIIESVTRISNFNENEPYILAGFTDLHVHGGGGKDIMQASKAFETISKTHLRFGTTSFLATTMTAPFKEIEQSFIDLKYYFNNQFDLNASKLLGIHLEGPYISEKKLGAQPNFIKAATLKEIDHLNSIVPIKVITMAPEVFNHLNLISDISKRGIVVQIGHTTATYEQGIEALNQGAKSFTHLFNAMSSFQHREPGISGAALANAKFSEIIPDLLHVHPGAIKVAHKCIENLYYVTDSTAATGMPDGEYKLGSQTVNKCLGGVRLKDGTLAGSSLTMIQALKNLVSIGHDLSDISKRMSLIPNQLINSKNLGLIEKEYFADLLILNSNLDIENIYLNGESCDI